MDDVLKCMQADHENQHKPIEGICIAQTCQSSQRIWCVICLTKFHKECHRDQILIKEQVIEKIKGLQIYNDQEQRKQIFDAFIKMKAELIKELESLEKFLWQANYNPMIEEIQAIIKNSQRALTQSMWNQIETLIMFQQYEVPQQFTANTNKIQQLLTQFQQVLKTQTVVRKINTQCDWLITDVNKIMIKEWQSIKAIDCSPDGQQIAYCIGNLIRIYEPNQRKYINNDLKGEDRLMLTVKYSKNQEVLASGSGDSFQTRVGTIYIWNPQTHDLIKKLKSHTCGISSIAFSPDSQSLVSGSWDMTLKIWDFKQGLQVGKNLISHTNYVTSVDYSANGQFIISASCDGLILLWNPQTGLPIKQINNAVIGNVFSIQYSKYDMIVSGSGDGSVRIWNTNNEPQIGRQIMLGHTDWIRSVSFSPDSNLIVSGSKDQTVRLWNATTGQEIGIVHHHTDRVNCVAFSCDGKYVLSGSEDGRIKITNLNILKPKSTTCGQM